MQQTIAVQYKPVHIRLHLCDNIKVQSGRRHKKADLGHFEDKVKTKQKTAFSIRLSQ